MADRLREAMKERARSQTVLGQSGSAQDIADQVVTFCRVGKRAGACCRRWHVWRHALSSFPASPNGHKGWLNAVPPGVQLSGQS